MSQTVAAIAELGPAYTGLAIGYRVLNLDGTTYSAFSTSGVSETGIAGTYAKSGGAVFPDAGGRIVWGVSGTDYAEDTVDPAPPTAAQIDTQLSGTHGADSWSTATGFATPTDVSDAQEAIITVIPGVTVIADAILSRSVAYVEDTAGVHTIAGLILAAFESSAPGTTWTIYRTDGVTTFATRTLNEDISAKPVTGVS